MSNLGWYQKMTTLAKKVGGPLPFLGIVALGGYAIGRMGEAGAKTIYKSFKEKKYQSMAIEKQLFTVKVNGKSNEGLQFSVGEQFKVLEIDGDAVLIEKIGDMNNPYFVSVTLLRSISDFDL